MHGGVVRLYDYGKRRGEQLEERQIKQVLWVPLGSDPVRTGPSKMLSESARGLPALNAPPHLRQIRERVRNHGVDRSQYPKACRGVVH